MSTTSPTTPSEKREFEISKFFVGPAIRRFTPNEGKYNDGVGTPADRLSPQDQAKVHSGHYSSVSHALCQNVLYNLEDNVILCLIAEDGQRTRTYTCALVILFGTNTNPNWILREAKKIAEARGIWSNESCGSEE